MEIIRNMVPKSKYDIKCPYTITPTRVVIHNTANDASAENEVSYMINNNNEVSFHYAVDDEKIVQGIEENRNTWSCGDGNGPGNMQGINIEICYSKSGGERFDKAERRAAQFAAEILKRYGWGIDKITKHQDFNGKYCPHRTLDYGWDRFVNMVNDYLNNKPQGVEWIFDANASKWCAKKDGNWVYGWLKDNDKWYYLNSEGYMVTGWLKDGNEWYYLKPEQGEMITGWLWDDSYQGWFYLNPDKGNMVTGWLKDNETWYYLKPDFGGKMACNEYISEPGKMTKYWLDESGKWIE